jgi:hypothetical protein
MKLKIIYIFVVYSKIKKIVIKAIETKLKGKTIKSEILEDSTQNLRRRQKKLRLVAKHPHMHRLNGTKPSTYQHVQSTFQDVYS